MLGSVRSRLSVMMFLQYVIWGAWLPLLSTYLTQSLGFSGNQVAWVMNAFAIASLTAMFVSSQIADRYSSTEKFLAVSHLVGGAAMIALAFQRSFWPFLLLMLVHALFYVPTLSLTNSISFANLKDATRDFGGVRLWGTIGWIAASWPFVFLLKGKEGQALGDALSSIFLVSGGAALLLAAFCFSLPHTPPAKNAEARFAPLEVLKLLAVPTVLVLFLVTFLDAVVHQCYFFWTGPFLQSLGLPENWIMPAMSIGQIAEIGTMAVLGLALKRLGWRTTMIVGILGHVMRFFVYSVADPSLLWLVIAINVVHGICYAFFFASVYIFVDEWFPKDARASAQSLFNILILGAGPFVGNLVWGNLGDVFKAADGIHFQPIFRATYAVGIVAALALFLFFRPSARAREGAAPQASA
jgi:nucleoside transporter